MRYYLTKAIQDDSRRSGERNRLLLEARRAEVVRRPRTDPAALVRRLVQLLFRQADRRAAAEQASPPLAPNQTI